MLGNLFGTCARVLLVVLAVSWAYDIRLFAVRTFGRLIHEFDPWFNFHATRYLFENGIEKFFKWFDHTSWYPLGRPVGTTIYPGMQLTSVFLYHVFEALGVPMSLNDICVFVPAWFGAVASVLTGLLAAECSGVKNAAPAAALVMAIIPAHLMRSVGGGYDNESIAVTAMVATFLLWVRSLRTDGSWPFAFLAGLAHVYMVAAWGGYVFVINMIGVSAAVMMLIDLFLPPNLQKAMLRNFDFTNALKAYTLFFVVGTAGAVQVPVVGWTPLRSMEQIGPVLVFCAYVVLLGIELMASRRGLARGTSDYYMFRWKLITVAATVGAIALAMLLQTPFFGGLSLRVKGLFIAHTKTGNPLVDSVAEHQPATKSAYWQYLHYMCSIAPVGFFMNFWRPTPGNLFMILYGALGYFSLKMNRLIILLGPVTSALAGIALGGGFDWCMTQLRLVRGSGGEEPSAVPVEDDKQSPAPPDRKGGGKGDKKARGSKASASSSSSDSVLPKELSLLAKELAAAYNSQMGKMMRVATALLLLGTTPLYLSSFFKFSYMFAEMTSQPSIVFQAQLQSGERIIVTDYLDCYNWIRENTPEDSRVLSWWDYGYQISGIANRTTLADGNTWNLEHISLIARCLTSDEKKAHGLIRHLADYVLVWSGGGGDDLAKLPHIARIGNSVYPDICPNDPLCHTFGFYDQRRTPMPRTAKSIVYKMVENGVRPGVNINENYWEEVYKSRYGKVRVYKVKKVSKKSKKWLADPANRLCDAPGSWYCPGQYPPELPEIVGKSHANLDYAAHGGHGPAPGS